MYLRDKTVLLTGIVLILSALCTMVTVVCTATATGDTDPFDDEKVAEFLRDVDDENEIFAVGAAASIANDGFLLPAFAVLGFLLFRDRSRLLATLFVIGLAVGTASALVADGSNLLLIGAAEDFVKGGPNGIDAGDPSLLTTARVLGMMSYAFFNIAFTPFGLALISLGVLLARAPDGAINPPRWIGWVAMIMGVSAILAWLVLAADPFFVFFPINLLSTLIFALGLGGWLIAHQKLEPAA